MLSDSTNNIITCKESRLIHNENHDFHSYSVLPSRTKDEKRRCRRDWQIQQERERQHEELKQRKILECELKQALKYAQGKSSHHNRSKSASESPSYLRSRIISTASKSRNLHEK